MVPKQKQSTKGVSGVRATGRVQEHQHQKEVGNKGTGYLEKVPSRESDSPHEALERPWTLVF